MSYKKHYWTTYGSKAKSINIGVKDNFGQTIESFRLEKGRELSNERTLKKIEEKYDFKLSPKEKEDIEKIEIPKEKENDKDSQEPNKNNWLDRDFKW